MLSSRNDMVISFTNTNDLGNDRDKMEFEDEAPILVEDIPNSSTTQEVQATKIIKHMS